MNQIYYELKIPKGGNALGIDIPDGVTKDLDGSIKSMKPHQVPEIEADFLMVYANDLSDLKSKSACLNYVRYDGMLWVLLPESINFDDRNNSAEYQNLMKQLNIKEVQSNNIGNGMVAYRYRPLERAI